MNNVPVELVEVFDGSAATVSVVKRLNSLRIKVNNFYSLGGTDARNHEERQTHLPLLMHENPKSVYFLGMGTGITAGAAAAIFDDFPLLEQRAPCLTSDSFKK